MAVSYDNFTASTTGTNPGVSVATISWNHTVSTNAQAVVVFVFEDSNTDYITGVTYGGVAMTDLGASYRAVDTTTEPGSVKTYFLYNPAISDGQVVISCTNNATEKYGVCVSLDGASTKVLAATGPVKQENDAAITSTAVTDGSPGSNSLRLAAAYTGLAAPVTADGANSTTLVTLDSGNYGYSVCRETTAGQGSRSVGFTGASDDRAVIHFAVAELYNYTARTATDTGMSFSDSLALTKRFGRTLKDAGFSDPYPYYSSIGGSAFAVGSSAGTNTQIAQSFVGDGRTITTLTYWVGKVGTPTDDLIIEIQSDSSGSPSGSVVQAVDTLSDSEVAGLQNELKSIPSFNWTPTDGVTYWFVGRRSGSIDSGNRFHLGSIAGLGNTNTYKFYNGSVWASGTGYLGIAFSYDSLARLIPTRYDFTDQGVSDPLVTSRYVSQIGTQGSGNDQFDSITGICTDGTYLYTTDFLNNRFGKRLASDLSYVSKIGSAGNGNDLFGNIYAIAVDSTGTYLYATDSTGRTLKRNASDLSWVTHIGSTGSGNDQLSSGYGICTDGTYVYIADAGNNRIVKKLASDLSYVSQIGTTGSGDDQFNFPRGITTDGTHVYVVDANNNRIVKRLCSTLAYVSQIGSSGGGNDQFNVPQSIGIDPTNTWLYVADSDNNRIVRRLASTLAYVGQTGTPDSGGTGDNSFSNPCAVDADANHMYVADSSNYRIVKKTVSFDAITKSVVAGGPASFPRTASDTGMSFSESLATRRSHTLSDNGCVPIAAPATAILDTFSGTLSSWYQHAYDTSSGVISISGGAIVGTAGDTAAICYQPPFTAGNLECYLTVVTGNGAETQLRLTNNKGSYAGGDPESHGYFFRYADSGGGWDIRIQEGDYSSTIIMSGTLGSPLAAGDKIAVQRIASQIIAWRTLSGVWTEIGRVTNTTYNDLTTVGLHTYDNSSTYDNFGGGIPTLVYDSLTTTKAKGRAISDTGFTFSESLLTRRNHVLTDTGSTVTESLVRSKGQFRTITDTGSTVTETIVDLRTRPITDTGFTFSETLVSRASRFRTLSDTGATNTDSLVRIRLNSRILVDNAVGLFSGLYRPTLLDDFNRADGTLFTGSWGSGPGWGLNLPAISSNEVVPDTTELSWALYYSPLGAKSKLAIVEKVASAGSGGTGIGVRSIGFLAWKSSTSGYFFEVALTQAKLWRRSSSVFTGLAQVTVSISVNDLIGATFETVSGQVIVTLFSSAGGTGPWVEQAQWIDTAPGTASGNWFAGICGYGSSASTPMRLDDFRASDATDDVTDTLTSNVLRNRAITDTGSTVTETLTRTAVRRALRDTAVTGSVARNFNGSITEDGTSSVSFFESSLDLSSGYTVFGVVRPTANSLSTLFYVSNFGIYITADGYLRLGADYQEQQLDSTWTFDLNEWQIFAITKADGTAAPRFHKYSFSTKSWTRFTHGTTLDDTLTPESNIQIGNNAFRPPYDISAIGLFDTALSDATLDTIPGMTRAQFVAMTDLTDGFFLDQDTTEATPVPTPSTSGFTYANQFATTVISTPQSWPLTDTLSRIYTPGSGVFPRTATDTGVTQTDSLVSYRNHVLTDTGSTVTDTLVDLRNRLLTDLGIQGIIGLDAVSTGKSATSAVTFSHTIGARGNRILVVTTSSEHATLTNPGFIGVTYNGVAMTLAGSIVNPVEIASDCMAMWYLLEADLPAAGTYNVVVTSNISVSVLATAVSIYNGAQSAPVVVTAQTEVDGSTYANNITTVADGSWVFDGVSHNAATGTFTPDDGQTQRSYDNNASDLSAMGTSTKYVSNAGTTSLGWTYSPSFGRTTQVLSAFSPLTGPSDLLVALKTPGSTSYPRTASDTGMSFSESLVSLRNHRLSDTGTTIVDVLGPRIYHNLTDTGVSPNDSLVKLARDFRTISDTGFTFSETLVSRATRIRNISDTGFTFSETLVKLARLTRTISDTGFTFSESLVVVGGKARTITDTGFTFSETLVTLAKHFRPISDTGMTLTDVLAERISHYLTDTGVSPNDTLVKLAQLTRTISDTGFTFSETLVSRATRIRTITDTGLTQTDSLVKTQWLHFSISDTGVTNTDTIVDLRNRALSDTQTQTDSLVATRRLSITLSDTGVTQTDALIKGRYLFISDTGVTQTDTLVATRRLSLTLSDTGVTNTDSLVKVAGRIRTISDTGVTPNDSLVRFVLDVRVLSDTGVAFADVLAERINHYLTDTGVTPNDSLTRLLIATRSISDTGSTITDSLVIYRLRPKTITDTGLTHNDTLVSLRQFFRTNSDTLTFTDSLVKLARDTRTATDTGVSQSDSLASNRNRPLTDTLTQTDSLATRRNHVLTDTGVTQTDTVNVSSGLNMSISDNGVIQTDTLVATRRLSAALSDTGVTFTETIVDLRTRVLTDTGVIQTDTIVDLRNRVLSDTGITLVDVLAERINHYLTDTGLTQTDSLVRRLVAFRTATDTGLTQTDSLVKLVSRPRTLTDTGVTSTDSLASRRYRVLSTTGVTQTDSVNVTSGLSISVSDTGVSQTDSLVATRKFFKTVSDTGLTQTDTLSATRSRTRSLTDTGLTQTDSLLTRRQHQLTDTGMTLVDVLAERINHYLTTTGLTQTDSLVAEFENGSQSYSWTLTDTGVTTTDSLVRRISLTRSISTSLTFSDSLAVRRVWFRTLSDTGLTLADTLDARISIYLSDTALTLTDSIAVHREYYRFITTQGVFFSDVIPPINVIRTALVAGDMYRRYVGPRGVYRAYYVREWYRRWKG